MFRSFALVHRATPSNVLRSRLNISRHLSQDARATIETAVKSKPVVLFMKGTPDAPECGFSRAVVQILDLQGVGKDKMQTYNVLRDPQLRSDIKQFSDWPTIPQVFVNGEFVGGCDIVIGMHQSGELEKILEDGGVLPKAEESSAANENPGSKASDS